MTFLLTNFFQSEDRAQTASLSVVMVVRIPKRVQKGTAAKFVADLAQHCL